MPARTSRRGAGPTIAQIIRRRISRRDVLKGAAAATALVVAGAEAGRAQPAAAQALPGGPGIWFQPIAPAARTVDEVRVAPGHTVEVLLRWGDPVTADAPAFDPENLTAAAQAKQVGYNNDYLGFAPLPRGSASSDRGLLWVNHEYTNPEIMFRSYSAKEPTRAQVDYELASHGATIVELAREGPRMVVRLDSSYNRRITATTPIAIGGPAAGHPWLRTSADPTGRTVLGTLNNCAGGYTPWGTILTAEENFHQYFANAGKMPENEPRALVHARYGLPAGRSDRGWEDHHARFDLAREPNEPFRFGWVVEVDPYDPTAQPVKRTALGRFRHEGCTFAVSPSGRVAFYSGDDERFDYAYKFVTAKRWNPDDRAANRDLLDDGTLYVARFNDDGTGEWLPLVHGQGRLTWLNGFDSQADVLLKTRLAADEVGATRMDRPEDIQQNPVNGKIYMAMTNNNLRGGERRPGTDKANPRRDNRWGHILEVAEADGDVASTRFRWEIFMLCGDPKDSSTYFAGFPKEGLSPIAAPDNLNFDNAGNLWIATDGQPSAIRYNDGVYVVPTDGPQRGNVQLFLTAVAGAETASLEFTPDTKTFFVSIQHPGEEGTFDKPVSSWPDRQQPPRPAVVQVWSDAGGTVGVAAG